MLRALLFDVDGTLAETERDGHRPAFNAAFAAQDLDWHWDEQHYGALLQITGGRERITHFVREHDPQWLNRDDAEARVLAMHQDKNRRFAAHVAAGGIPLRPGLLPLIREARRRGLKLGIVTTTSRDNLEALLNASFDADFRAAFAVRVTAEDVRRKKPDGECYRVALAQLGIAADNVLALEDSRNGLRSASALGIATVIVRSHYFADEDFSGAAAVVDSFEALHLAGLAALLAPVSS